MLPEMYILMRTDIKEEITIQPDSSGLRVNVETGQAAGQQRLPSQHSRQILQPRWQDQTQSTARRKLDKFMRVTVKHSAATAHGIAALI